MFVFHLKEADVHSEKQKWDGSVHTIKYFLISTTWTLVIAHSIPHFVKDGKLAANQSQIPWLT